MQQHLFDIDVRVPMRDGVALAANVWRPAEGKAPALLVRLPYGKDGLMGSGHALMPDTQALLEAGYAVIAQDCRGTHRSEGEFVPHMADQPYWGRRVHELGAGPKPLPRHKLTATGLASALRAATGDAGLRAGAERLAASIRSEDGVAESVRLIRGIVPP